MFVSQHFPPRPEPEVEIRLTRSEAERLAGLLSHVESCHESLVDALGAEGIRPRAQRPFGGPAYVVSDRAARYFAGSLA